MLPFSPKPGAHERKLKRRMGNNLFPEDLRKVKESELIEAQHADFEELQAFLADFQSLVEKAAGLDPNAESDVILKLKEQVDQAYERCAGLGGDLDQIRMALQKLIEVMMAAVRKSAGDDPVAEEKLAMEDDARFMHFSLLEYPFIADMLRQDDLIAADELVPNLLSEEPHVVDLATRLFDEDQLALLTAEAEQLLEKRSSEGLDMTNVWQSFVALKQRPAKS
jgi:hypothetical protein